MALLRNALLGVCLGLMVQAFALPTAKATTPIGADVTNVAQFTYDHPSGPITTPTNPATFRVVARPTPSTIEFFRYSPNAPDGIEASLFGSDYSPSGMADADDFTPIGEPVTLGGQLIDISKPVTLTPAATYFAGELVIVQVTDAGHNGDPERIEQVNVSIATADTGGFEASPSAAGDAAPNAALMRDEIILRLYETGPDTGTFMAWVPSTPADTPSHDDRLTAPKQTQLTARYVDEFDATEVSVDTALVDPFGRLFDSLTGELINGATVTIVEDVTGAPAEVFGIDGVSAYPSTLVTGGSVTDASGAVYELEPGEFLFPQMRPGDYRLEITPPANYAFPSGFQASVFDGLDNGPFEIIPGSYGEAFTVEATGPLNFDVPLDTTSGLTVTKQSSAPTAAIGDFISYTVRVENTQSARLPLIVRDILPRGMRLVDGSARIGAEPVQSVSIAGDGRTITFDAGWIDGETRRELTYVVAVGAGTPNGTVINSAFAISPAERPLSNTAEAAIDIREDLLRSEITLVGRVAEDACSGDDAWARSLRDGTGVGGVRLYLETGEYVVTDEDGLYHFQGIEARTHVVQIDMETLPAGYEPMVCEENSRYAGSAISKFVDAQGGTIWRANFYLKRTGEVEEAAETTRFEDVTDYKNYDRAWLDAADAEIGWAYPETGQTPSQQSVNLGLIAPDRASVSLSLNGRDVPATNVQSRITSTDQSKALFRWRGVDIHEGENVFRAEVRRADGAVKTLEKRIWFVTEAQRARLVDDQSVLVADGRTPPVLAVRLEDGDGHAVHAGRLVEVDVAAPYTLQIEDDFELDAPVGRAELEASGVAVGEDGILRVTLDPTLETGRVRIRVPLREGRFEDITAYLRPEKRDWILVGLAEGELGYRALDDASPITGDELLRDGRIALFAKGMVRGEWLLTLAIDTAKRRGDRDDELFEDIDPNAYYTLYGDRTYQNHDAESRYPLFLKLEKNTAQILFGDFNTDLTDTELGRYNRRLSGLRVINEGERVSVTGFAAETNQGFVKDELAADGTSGPYRLTTAPIVRNSEIITVETRDRLRQDVIISQRTLTRYVDYEIDYTSGELIFRRPVDATDTQFNENVIVVDYEAVSDAERNLTYGGRVALRGLDQRVELGVSHIREDGAPTQAGAESEVSAVDLTVQVTEALEVRAEVATSMRRPGEDGQAEQNADAWLLEAVHQGETVTATAFVREEQAGFGVGQTGSNTQAARRYGAQASALIGDTTEADTGARQTRTLNAEAYREETLDTGAERSVASLGLQQAGQLMTVGAGLRTVNETAEGEVDRQSLQATVNASRVFPDLGLTLTAAHEQPLSESNGDEVSLFPQRTLLGLDKQLTSRAVFNLRHELTDGQNASGDNTTAGLTLLPWSGGRVSTGLSQVSQENSQRLSAISGVDQTIRLTETWSASLGAANRTAISGADDARDLLADDAVNPLAEGQRSVLTLDEGFTSAYAGLGYRGATATGSARIEYRQTASSNRITLAAGAAREVTQSLSYAGAARFEDEETDIAGERRSMDARVAAAWRPRGEGPVVLNRLDFRQDEQIGQSQTWKLVNNLGVNAMLTDRTQVAGYYGVKYSDAQVAGVQVNGFTHLVGGEVRHDITKRWDVGLRGMALVTAEAETMEYTFGPSVGFSPKKNIWASVGYNVWGFSDRDFEAAEYADQGVVFQLRAKFDQLSVGSLLDRVSPQRS